MEKMLQIKKDTTLSNALYIAKMFAVISIVLAHTGYTAISNEYIKSFLSIYQVIGVYIFLILSGYFFNTSKYRNILELLKDKFIKIGIPWIILGTLNFIIITYWTRGIFDCLGYVNFLLGNGSYLYFITILFMCYIIIYMLPKENNKYIYCLIAINVVSILLTSLNIFPQIVNSRNMIFSYFNPYLNIMNWIGIFGAGILLRKSGLLEKFTEAMGKKWYIILFSYIVTCAILCLFKVNISYWNLVSIIIGIFSFIVVVAISMKLKNFEIFIDIGKKSFCIYQIHLIFLGKIFNNVYQESSVFAIIRPIVTVVSIYFVIVISRKIAKIIKLDKIYDSVLGVR